MKTALLMIAALITMIVPVNVYAIHESPVPVNTPKNNSTVSYPIMSGSNTTTITSQDVMIMKNLNYRQKVAQKMRI